MPAPWPPPQSAWQSCIDARSHWPTATDTHRLVLVQAVWAWPRHTPDPGAARATAAAAGAQGLPPFLRGAPPKCNVGSHISVCTHLIGGWRCQSCLHALFSADPAANAPRSRAAVRPSAPAFAGASVSRVAWRACETGGCLACNRHSLHLD